MGLDTSHDCWHGAYSAFMRWRIAVAWSVNVVLDYMEGFAAERPGMKWELVLGDNPLVHLLHHSDCDGQLESDICNPLANELAKLLPQLPKAGDMLWRQPAVWPSPASGNGWYEVNEHEAAWYLETTEWFIRGLRAAAAAGESVDFH